jgi:hypothetical protein
MSGGIILSACNGEQSVRDIIEESRKAHAEVENFRLEAEETTISLIDEHEVATVMRMESSVRLEPAEEVWNKIEVETDWSMSELESMRIDDEEYINFENRGWTLLEEAEFPSELEELGLASVVNQLNEPTDENTLLQYLAQEDLSRIERIEEENEEDYILTYSLEEEEVADLFHAGLGEELGLEYAAMMEEMDWTFHSFQLTFHIDQETYLQSYMLLEIESEMEDSGSSILMDQVAEFQFFDYNQVDSIEAPELAENLDNEMITDEEVELSQEEIDFYEEAPEETRWMFDLFLDQTESYEVHVSFETVDHSENVNQRLNKHGQAIIEQDNLTQGYFVIDGETAEENNTGEIFWDESGEYIKENDGEWEASGYSAIGTHSVYRNVVSQAAYFLTESGTEKKEGETYHYSMNEGIDPLSHLSQPLDSLLAPFVNLMNVEMLDTAAEDFSLEITAEFDEDQVYMTYFTYTLSQGDQEWIAVFDYAQWDELTTIEAPEDL